MLLYVFVRGLILMEYIFDFNSISELISVTENLYYKYKEILNVRYRDDNYYHLIGELTSLSNKEDELLLSLPKSGRLLEDINNSIRKVYKCDNYIMYNSVLDRIDSNICNLCALEDEELKRISNVSFIDSQGNINSIYDELYFNFILRLNGVIDGVENLNSKRKIRFIQLINIFSFKNISDAFINNNLCLEDNLVKRCEDDYKDIDLYNSFIYLKNNTAFNLCESLLMRNISLAKYYNDESNDVFYLSNMLLFKSLLNDISDSDLIQIRNTFMFDFDEYEDNNFIIKNLKSCLDLEYERRFSLEKNKNVQLLDENLSSNLILLLKLEEVLYDKIMNLNLDGFDCFDVISSLVDFESDILNKIDVNKDNADVVSSVIFRDLDFFMNSNDNFLKKKSIIMRLKNSIDYFKKYDLADGVLEKNYSSIMSNHIVDSIKKFDGDLSIIKNYLYMYPELFNDLILMSGNYHMIDRFSDETTSLSLGNNSIYDFYYDKNEQLYKLFTYIIDDIVRYDDMYESDWNELFNFKICELSDIIDNVSDEHLFEIREEIFSLDDGVIKNKILALLKNKVH